MVFGWRPAPEEVPSFELQVGVYSRVAEADDPDSGVLSRGRARYAAWRRADLVRLRPRPRPRGRAGALEQVSRVAPTRGFSAAVVHRLVEAHVQGREAGYLGEQTVNVLDLNVVLAQLKG
ncbi:potassium-transporting ATPase subunit C [Frondihabitans sp. PAMC 28766]|uniref:potassium-transporting ATPase subunit C n=1 Tax=Frondihabitans sp. PAMC 28766 TaxID=1795630 RepID=UPI001EF4C995|nr:potassium-transporting ATPase subunit C [Frondihabitans sp. PAMC 28766]